MLIVGGGAISTLFLPAGLHLLNVLFRYFFHFLSFTHELGEYLGAAAVLVLHQSLQRPTLVFHEPMLEIRKKKSRVKTYREYFYTFNIMEFHLHILTSEWVYIYLCQPVICHKIYTHHKSEKKISTICSLYFIRSKNDVFKKMSNLIAVYTMLNGSIDRYFTF